MKTSVASLTVALTAGCLILLVLNWSGSDSGQSVANRSPKLPPPLAAASTVNTSSPTRAGAASGKDLKQVVAQSLAEERKNFDKRLDDRPAPPLSERQRLAVEALRREVPDVQVDFDPLLGSSKYVGSTSQFLTQSQTGLTEGPLSYEDAMAKVKAYVRTHPLLFAHGVAALDSGKVTRQDTTAATGLQTLAWQQMAAGLPVFQTLFKANLSKTGEIMTVASEFMPDADAAARDYIAVRPDALTAPAISVQQAVSVAAGTIGKNVAAESVIKTASPNPELRAEFFNAPGLSSSWAEQVWLPMDANTVRLAWEVTVEAPESGMFTVLVDAESGDALLRQSLTAADVAPQYRVWTGESPTPMSPGFSTAAAATSQPPLVARQLVQLESVNPVASPEGWIPPGGTTTTGNNVDAYADRDGNDLADPGSRPTGTGTDSRTFDFAIDLAQDPSTHIAGSVTQLFYWCNWMHDQLYSLGFTETSGNFQTNNYGRNGNPAIDPGDQDSVRAEAQYAANPGATGGQQFNNAYFLAPQDGIRPRMQMYLFSGPNPDREACFDAQIVLHEYAHGLSNRLVGDGAVHISQLQSLGMEEGWSDFYALSFLSNPQGDPHAKYPMGCYVARQWTIFGSLGEANYYWGIRRYPYATDLNVNPLTFKDIDPAQANPHSAIPTSPLLAGRPPADERHAMGEVWCSMLWEARARMIDRYGHAVGNQAMLQIVTDGMKLSPSNPSFIQARNAILQADMNNNAGANLHMLWNAFAKRGLGNNATSPASNTTVGLVEDFTLPVTVDATPPVVAFSPLVNQQAIFEFTSSGPEAVGGTVNEPCAVTFGIVEYNTGSTPNRYWDGATWAADATAPGTKLSATVSGNTWSPAAGVVLPLSADLRNGFYLVTARAVDNGGNVAETNIVVRRTVAAETTPPLVQINYPWHNSTIAGFTSIMGTASDPPGGSGLTGVVNLNIINAQGEYWTGSSWSATQATVGANVQANGSWQFTTLPGGPDFRTGAFIINATAYDWAGNTSVPQSGVTNVQFTVNLDVDTTPPTLVITQPFPSGLATPAVTQISGTAADTGGSGLTHYVTLTLYQNGDYWNGTSWQGAIAELTVPVEGNLWVFDQMPTGANARPGVYSVSAASHDLAGNSSTPQPGVTSISFTIDGTAPTGSITAPLDGGSFATFPAFTGTATDSSGIQAVVLYLRRNRDWKYWSGSSWVTDAYQAALASTYNPGNNTFTGNFTLPTVGVNSIGGSYNYIAIPVDNAGNHSQYDAQVTITYHATFTWTGASPGANNLWDDPENWNSILPEKVFIPGEEDIALIPSGTVTVFPGENFSVYELHLTGGVFTANTVTVTNSFQMLNGTLHGTVNLAAGTVNYWSAGILTGQLNIGVGTALLMETGYYKYLGAAGKPGTINNQGTIFWTSNYSIYAQGGAGSEGTINNLPTGVFDIGRDGEALSYNNSYVGNVFNNQGRIVKSGGSGVSSLFNYWTVVNEPGGVIENAVAGAGSRLERSAPITPLTLKNGTVIRGPGAVQLAGGNVFAEAGSWTVEDNGKLRLAGMTLECPQAGGLTLSPETGSTLEWLNGRITGTLNVPAGATLSLPSAGSYYKYLGAAGKPGTINNSGVLSWQAGGYAIYAHGGAGSEGIINNLLTGVFEIVGDGNPASYENSATGNTFNNQGRVVKTTGSGIAYLFTYWSFVNEPEGIIENASSTAGNRLERSGSSSPCTLKDETTLRGPGTIGFGGGTITGETGTWTVDGNGLLDLAGMTLDGPQTGNLTLAAAPGAALQWRSGTINGNISIPEGVTLNLPVANSYVKNLGSAGKHGTINNSGVMSWEAGGYGIYAQGGTGSEGVINNLATAEFRIVGDGSPLSYNSSAVGNEFNNSGVLLKTSGSGAAPLYYWTINNIGQAGALDGTLDFYTTVNFNDGTRFNSGGTANCRIVSGTATFRGSSLVAGNMLIHQGGTLTGHADGTGKIEGGIFDWTGGTVAGTLRFGSTANVRISGGAAKTLAANAILNNAGIVNWLGGYIVGNGNAAINNLAGGTFNAPASGYFDYNAAGNTFTNSGVLNIGASPGSLTFTSNWSFAQTATGLTNLEIGGTSTSQFDRILCSGPVLLGGALNVTLINNFVPAIGNDFAIMTYASRTGAFDIFNSPGGYFSRNYNPGNLTLIAIDAPENLAEWKDAYFATGSPASADNADPDNDGVPNLLEYATGGNPLNPGAAQTPLDPPVGGFIDFYYTRSIIAMAELNFQVQWTDDLLAAWQSTGVSESVLSDNGVIQQVKATVPAGTAGRRFVRLKVTRP